MSHHQLDFFAIIFYSFANDMHFWPNFHFFGQQNPFFQIFDGFMLFHLSPLWHCFTLTLSCTKGPLSEWSFFGFPGGGSLGNLIHTQGGEIWSNFFAKKMLKALLLQPFKVHPCIHISSLIHISFRFKNSNPCWQQSLDEITGNKFL